MRYLLASLLIVVCASLVAGPFPLGKKSDQANLELGLVFTDYYEFDDNLNHMCPHGKLDSLPQLAEEQYLVIGIPDSHQSEDLWLVYNSKDVRFLGTCPRNDNYSYYLVSKDKITIRKSRN